MYSLCRTRPPRTAPIVSSVSPASRPRQRRLAWPLPPQLTDLAVAAVVALLTGLDAAVNGSGHRQADWLTWLLFAVSVAALLVRSRWPVAVTVVTGAACAGWALYGHIGELLNLPVMVALYALAVRGDRRRTLRTAVVAALVSGGGLGHRGQGRGAAPGRPSPGDALAPRAAAAR